MTQLTKSRIKALALHIATAALTLLTWVAAQGDNPFHGLVPDGAWTWATLAAALVMGVYDGWRNHNWTPASIAAQNILDAVKNDSKRQALSTAENVDQSKVATPVASAVQASLGVPAIAESTSSGAASDAIAVAGAASAGTTEASA
jgi:hypothetical protein